MQQQKAALSKETMKTLMNLISVARAHAALYFFLLTTTLAISQTEVAAATNTDFNGATVSDVQFAKGIKIEILTRRCFVVAPAVGKKGAERAAAKRARIGNDRLSSRTPLSVIHL